MEILNKFLELSCVEHPPSPNAHRPFIDAAFLYGEYCQYSKVNMAHPVDKKTFVKVISEKFPTTGLVKIGPHPHFMGVAYRTWVPKKS